MNKWLKILILVIVLVILVGILMNINWRGENEIEPPLIEGCAGVSLENQQECCNNWAEENNIFKPACVGEWVIENNQCAWECQTFG